MKLDELGLSLLFDYYGELLTKKQQSCFDLYYNQDLSLGEIAQETGVSRQGVHDSLLRAETALRTIEEKTGSVKRDRRCRQALAQIQHIAQELRQNQDPQVQTAAQDILDAIDTTKE